MALAAAGGAPLARESNPELDSILGHTPLKENEGGWSGGGGYGYSGTGQNFSGARYGRPSHEEWELSNSRFEPYNQPPQLRVYNESSGNITPTYTNQQPEDRSLSSPPRKVDTDAPSTGLHTVGVSLTDPGPTNPGLAVNSRHISKRSVEVVSGHGIGRSFRASVEGGNEYSS